MSKDPTEQANHSGTAGVIARPPVLFLVALVLGLVLDHFLPLPVAGLEADLVPGIGAGALIPRGALALAVG
jgi:hypothetical protein